MFISRRSLLAAASAIPLLTWIDELRAQVAAPRLRPSCYSSSSTTHLATLRAGVAAMKALPSTDARSWLNVANIHKNSCQHRQWWFPHWHRLYLLNFEAIIAKLTGKPDFALPFWAYKTNPALPSAFRLPASSSNPLYTSRRASTINAGQSLPSSAVSDAAAIATLPYVSSSLKVGFGGPAGTAKTIRGPDPGALEGQPHGPVHTAIGGSTGLMSQVSVSAQDPIFWMHHCNIDRLIEYWYAKSAGREYPTANSTWLDQVFTFTDLL